MITNVILRLITTAQSNPDILFSDYSICVMVIDINDSLHLTIIKLITTSAKDIMILPALVCLFIC